MPIAPHFHSTTGIFDKSDMAAKMSYDVAKCRRGVNTPLLHLATSKLILKSKHLLPFGRSPNSDCFKQHDCFHVYIVA